MLHIYITAFHILQADSLGVNSGASKLYVALRPQFRWSTLKPEMGWLENWLLVTPPRWITIFPIFTCHKWWLYHGIPYFQTHPHGGPTGKTAWSSLCYGHGCSLRWMAQVQPSQRDHQGEKLREPGMSLPFHLSLGCFDDGYHWLPQIGYHGIPMDRSNFGAVWIILGYIYIHGLYYRWLCYGLVWLPGSGMITT